MPLFRVYFLPEVSGNEPLDVDLGLTSDAIGVVTGPILAKRRSDMDEMAVVNIDQMVALDDVHDCNVREGDVVWRDWEQPKTQGLSSGELERQMRAYKPIWEPGPGWLELRQEKWVDVEFRQ